MESEDYATVPIDTRNKHRNTRTHNKRMNVKETRERHIAMDKRQNGVIDRAEGKEEALVQQRWQQELDMQAGKGLKSGTATPGKKKKTSSRSSGSSTPSRPNNALLAHLLTSLNTN